MTKLEQCSMAAYEKHRTRHRNSRWELLTDHERDCWAASVRAVIACLMDVTPGMVEAGQDVDGTITAEQVLRAMLQHVLDEGDK